MNSRKQVLGRLERVYAVCSLHVDSQRRFLAASEGRGECLMFSAPKWDISVVWSGPGGCMSLTPIPGRRGRILAIQGFYPVFQSEGAGIVYAEAGKDIRKPWTVTRIADLPFVHRIEIVQRNSMLHMVASTICGGKTHQDDWSRPGVVYACSIPMLPSHEWSLRPVLKNISKNHGMRRGVLDGEEVVMVSGVEGLFSLKPRERPGLKWDCRRLLEREVSDMFVYDLDGDGCPEIVTIEPFHGDMLVVYKRFSNVWKSVYDTFVGFGHVVWAGRIRGRPAIIIGSRSGRKDLSILFPDRRLKSMDRRILDDNAEPVQITVVHTKDADLVLSANQEQSEIALYELTD